jgi:hypothetical protein
MNFNIKESNKTKEKRNHKERRDEELTLNPNDDKDDLINLDTNISSR